MLSKVACSKEFYAIFQQIALQGVIIEIWTNVDGANNECLMVINVYKVELVTLA